MMDKKNGTEQCTVSYKENKIFLFDRGWKAIPETIVLNLILFFFFLIIFILLRRAAWDRKHIRRTSKGWLQSIYGDRKLATKNLQAHEDDPIIHHKHDIQINQPLLPPAINIELPTPVCAPAPGFLKISGDSNDETIKDEERQGTLSMSFEFVTNIPANLQATFTEVGYKLSDVLLITNADILRSRGSDALQYILFQQYIIYFLGILTIFCICVVLPVNLQGKFYGIDQPYGRTTIINIRPEDQNYYLVHVLGSAGLSIIGAFIMYRFSKVIKLDDEEITRRTLLIRRIPKKKRDKDMIANYFEKVVPKCEIEGIQSVYNIRKLMPITDELTNLINARRFCSQYQHDKNESFKIRPYIGGEFGCLCGCKKVDGLKYYTAREEATKELIIKEYWNSLSNPTGAFFITFQTEEMAQKAFIHLKKEQERALSFCPFSDTARQLSSYLTQLVSSRKNDKLQVTRWMVSYAPYPNDINWCDVSVNLTMQWTRSICVNVLLLIFFVFISTPSVILNGSDTLKIMELFKFIIPEDIESKIPGLVSPLILVISASVLPAIVTLACQFISYTNISAKNHAIMWKVYLFLVLMVIVWPSLGFASLRAFFVKVFIEDKDFLWDCLFPVELGSFFVNYTIQAGFIGNIMELMRLPELLIYLWYRATARSRAEKDTATRYVVWDFAIGMRYPRFLLIFAMVVTYSMSCPIITIAGLIYMVMKHLIDRYNIYHVYNPSKINSKIHSSAIMFVHIALIMMQAQIFTVTFLQTQQSKIFRLALLIMVVSLLAFSGHFFFYTFRNINHLTYRATRKKPTSRREYCACAYLPPVLYDLSRSKLIKSPSTQTSGLAGVSSVVDIGTLAPGGDHPASIATTSTASGTTSHSGCTTTINLNGATVSNGSENSGASSQNLLVPTIDTSDAFFLHGGSNECQKRPRFSQHKTTLLPARRHQNKSRRTASDGQQQFHPSKLLQYGELPLKRTNSDLDKVSNQK